MKELLDNMFDAGAFDLFIRPLELPIDICAYYEDYERRMKNLKETDNELERHH